VAELCDQANEVRLKTRMQNRESDFMVTPSVSPSRSKKLVQPAR
jgi:hypothetical protein